MKWTISLPNLASVGELGSVDALVTAARHIEELGFDAGWVSDHPFPKLIGGGEHHASDPLSTLGFVAAVTTDLLLQTGIVVAPFRNPFLLANQAATVDVLSRGRLVLGFGTGYLEPEFHALGVDFRKRGAMTREAVTAWKAAWSGNPIDYVGRGFEATGNSLRPLPVRRPGPLLWRGGNSDAALRQAATDCDGWNPAEAPQARASAMDYVTGHEMLRQRIDLLRSYARDEGRTTPIDVILTRPDAAWREAPKSVMREEIDGLERIGVTWTSVWFREVTTLREYLAKTEALAEALR